MIIILLSFFFKTNPAYYPDKSLPAPKADTPSVSYNKAEIPGSGRCRGFGPRF